MTKINPDEIICKAFSPYKKRTTKKDMDAQIRAFLSNYQSDKGVQGEALSKLLTHVLSHFNQPVAKKALTDPFYWVAQATSKSHAPNVQYVCVTEERLLATDNRRIYSMPNTEKMPHGIYDIKSRQLAPSKIADLYSTNRISRMLDTLDAWDTTELQATIADFAIKDGDSEYLYLDTPNNESIKVNAVWLRQIFTGEEELTLHYLTDQQVADYGMDSTYASASVLIFTSPGGKKVCTSLFKSKV